MKKLYTTTILVYFSCTILLLAYLISFRVSITSLYNGTVINNNEMGDQNIKRVPVILNHLIFKADAHLISKKNSEVLFAYKTVVNNTITTLKIRVKSLKPNGVQDQWSVMLSENISLADKGSGTIYEAQIIIRDKSPIYKVLLKSIFNPFNK